MDTGLYNGMERRMEDRSLRTRAACVKAFLLLVLAAPSGAPGSLLGLPPLQGNRDNGLAQRVELGRKLFFDRRLSRDGTISCASCHQPDKALADGLAVAVGVGRQPGTRNTPSLFNVAYNQSQFWEGRRPDLETQALDPFVNGREHGLQDAAALLALIQGDPGYRTAFQSIFPGQPTITLDQVGQALASFERTMLAGDSRFDRYHYAGESTALSEGQARGLSLFRGKAMCATCHTIDATFALFTDQKFHSLNVGLPRLAARLPQLTTQLVQSRQDGKTLDQSIVDDEAVAQLGRFAVTLDPADIGRFRTPSLRNVALTAPYMHDGSVATLEDAVDLEVYYRGVESGRPLKLTAGEKADLVAFLKALSSPEARVAAPASPDTAE